jgi:hypothetical protein
MLLDRDTDEFTRGADASGVSVTPTHMITLSETRIRVEVVQLLL